jgi:hypothetical protein
VKLQKTLRLVYQAFRSLHLSLEPSEIDVFYNSSKLVASFLLVSKGWRAVKRHRFGCSGMDKLQKRGVEQHLVSLFAGTVQAVTDYRRTQAHGPGMGCVNAELVGASGKGGKLQAGGGRMGRKFLPSGYAHLAMHRIVNL